MLHRIESLIDALKEMQLSNVTAINKLEGIKEDLILNREQTHGTKPEPREVTSANTFGNKSNNQASPDIHKRNTGTTPQAQHTDSKGSKIKVGDTIHVLSTGLFKGNRGVVTKLGKARVSLKLASGRNTNHKSTNLEVLQTDV